MGGRGFDVHSSHIFLTLFDVTLGNFFGGNAFLVGFCDDFIIHIGKVGHIVDLVALVLHVTAGCVKNDHRAGISDMDKVINRGAADVHLDLSRLQRHKFFFFLCQCVV